MRYCGSKHDHKPHNWQQHGRPNGPIFTCPGKPKQEVPLTDPLQLSVLDEMDRLAAALVTEPEGTVGRALGVEWQRARMRDV